MKRILASAFATCMLASVAAGQGLAPPGPIPFGAIGSATGSEPITVHGADPTGATPSDVAFAAALATGRTVLVPVGSYHVTKMIVLQPGQQLVCMGRTVSQITVGADFSPTAPGVIEMATTEPASEIHDCGISFAQPPDQTSRANFLTLGRCTAVAGGSGCKYPPAIIGPNAPRPVLDHVRISGAWDGVSLPTNPGGLWFNDLEIGALDVGLLIDTAYDFCHIQGYHFWPFGMGSGSLLTSVYGDGSTIAAKFGRCDGMSVEDIGTYQGKIQVLADASYADFTNMRLDTDYSDFSAAGGDVRIANLYSNKTTDTASSISNSGAELLITNIRANVSNPAPIVTTSAGETRIEGGVLANSNPAGQGATVTGGLLDIHDVHMAPGSSNRTIAYLQQYNGVLRLQGNFWDALVAGQTDPDAAFFNVDYASNMLSGNDLGGRSFTLQGPFVLGQYGPNKTPNLALPYTALFQTPGNSTVTFGAKDGYFWYGAGAINGLIHMTATLNAYATSGANEPGGSFVITGFPFSLTPASATANDGVDVQVLNYSGITLPSGSTGVTAKFTSAAGSAIILYGVGSNMAPAPLNTINVPPGASIELDIKFSIPLQ